MTATNHYHAGSNTPGYLPDTDEPASFATFDDAKTSMLDDLERDGDHLASDDDEDTRALADEYSAAAEDLNLDNGPEWSATLPASTSSHDLGRHYWIVQCGEDDCTTDDDDDDIDDDDLRGAACVDCTMLIANGETPPELDEDATAEYVARVEARTAGYHVALACEDDCEGSFSWSPCDVCGSPLGGDRHPVAFFEEVAR